MMTLSKALAAGQAKDYFEAEYTSTQESYYSEGEVVKGKWFGRQAEAWQLQGEVNSEHFERLCEGQHPLSGDQLVRHVTPHKYENAYGETIETSILIWTAGVLGNSIHGLDEKSMLKNQRYKVDNYNRIIGYENIFAIGDVASMETADEKGHPMLAPVAIQQATNLARNLNLTLGKWREFQYINKGILATVGRNKALSDIGGFHLHGFFAWIIWVFVHLFTLVGFRNRIIVFINWILNYFSFGSAIRLIIRPFKGKE